MKRRMLSLLILAVLVLTISGKAIEPRGINVKPSLSFDGTTAICFASCKGNSSTDEVKATLTLYQGASYIDSWSSSGIGRIPVSGECQVQGGRSYKLVLTYSINGVDKPSVSTTATCP